MTFALTDAQPHAAGSVAAVAPSTSSRLPELEAVWASTAEEVQAAQRLRWLVFADEMGARLRPPPGTPPGLDVDLFDAHCEHLLVRTLETEEAPAMVVGTYRVLPPAAAKLLGGLYAETEFDLVRLNRLRPLTAELGRSCIHPQWRSGGVILMLWTSLFDFLQRNRLEYMVGCASVPMHDGGRLAANLWHSLKGSHLAPPDLQVRARLPLPVDRLGTGAVAEPPALIKGYLRLGAKLLGAPAWDPDFGTADLPMMLRPMEMPPAYRRRFLGR